MIELYQAQDRVEAQMLKDFLSQQGVEVVIFNDLLSGAAGGVPANIYPTLWLLENQDFEKAKQLAEQFFSQSLSSQEPWHCEICGERIDAGFEVCWNCGTPGPNQNNKE
ncbi:MAG: DUF2007 domain-containing protein [Candidatus Thiodiazotropha sp. 6PLUC2]